MGAKLSSTVLAPWSCAISGPRKASCAERANHSAASWEDEERNELEDAHWKQAMDIQQCSSRGSWTSWKVQGGEIDTDTSHQTSDVNSKPTKGIQQEPMGHLVTAISLGWRSALDGLIGSLCYACAS